MSVATDTARVGSLGGSIGKKTILAVATLLVVVGAVTAALSATGTVEPSLSAQEIAQLRYEGLIEYYEARQAAVEQAQEVTRLQNMTAVWQARASAPAVHNPATAPMWSNLNQAQITANPTNVHSPGTAPMWSNLNQAQITANPNQVTPAYVEDPGVSPR